MAKTKISEFSTTAGNNTDINSINIAEGCAPSGINDAIRELMRQLKEFQTGGAGDSVNSGGDFSVATNKFTVASASGNTAVAGTLGVTGAATLSSTLAVTGTTTLTGALVANGNATLGDGSGDTVTVKGTPTLEVNPTLSGGTANGVLYLNGSKVATSGSALTFDGTRLEVLQSGVSSGGSVIRVYNTSDGIGAGQLQIAKFGSSASYGPYTANTVGINAASTSLLLGTETNNPVIFYQNNSEAMRLTSTGLGVGTSSPQTRLEANQTGVGSVVIPIVAANQDTSATGTGAGIGFVVDGVNDVIGAQIAGIRTGAAYHQSALAMYTRDSVGSGLLERMRIDSSGNIGLGVTPSAWLSTRKVVQNGNAAFVSAPSVPAFFQLSANTYTDSGGTDRYISTAASTNYAQVNGAHQWFTAPSGTAGDAITFTQALTLDASGNLGIGTTSPSFALDISNAAPRIRQVATTGANSVLMQLVNTGGTAYVGLDNSSGGLSGAYSLNLFHGGAYPIVFSTNGSERARIDSSGNLLVAKTDVTVTTNGVTIGAANYIAASRNNDTAGFFIRSGTDGSAVIFYKDTTVVGSISVNASATAYNTSSDYRLKENQQPLTDSGAFIDALQPKTWDWKTDGSKGVGFIAHEVQAVSPNSVVGVKDAVDEEGKPIYQAMEYGSAEFIANIIAELQSLRARVAQLESN